MSTWTTIAVALASSAVGGFLGTWWSTFARIRYEREEGLRTRMIEAADDFSFGGTEGILALQRAAHVLTEEDVRLDAEGYEEFGLPEEIEQIREAVDAVRPHVDLATARLSRIRLLFGAGSPAARAALELVGHLRHGITVMDEEIPEIGMAKREFLEAGEAHTRFISEARKSIEKPRFSEKTGEASSNAAEAR